jgi:uncharacterized protein YodC (DUF2158 family)
MTNRYDAARPDQPEEQVMDLKPGDVVILKSGGHPLSVAEVGEDGVECVWMGSEGDLYRETLPLGVLEIAETDPGDDEEDDGKEDDEDDDEDEDEDDEHESKVA